MEIRVETPQPHIVRVTIANEPRRNAMTRAMLADLAALWDRLDGDATCRCVVLTVMFSQARAISDRKAILLFYREFEQDKFSESITAYREFIQNHKNDPDIEYARYRVTKALFRDIDDTIFLPPQEERDQATAFDFKGTPSFIVGKFRVPGVLTMAQFAQVIADARKALKK